MANDAGAGKASLPYLVRVTGDRPAATLHPEVTEAAATRGTEPASLVADGDRVRVTDTGGAGVADVPRRPDAPAGDLLVVVDGGIVEAVVPGVDGPVAGHGGIPGDAPLRIGVTCADEVPARVFSWGQVCQARVVPETRARLTPGRHPRRPGPPPPERGALHGDPGGMRCSKRHSSTHP